MKPNDSRLKERCAAFILRAKINTAHGRWQRSKLLYCRMTKTVDDIDHLFPMGTKNPISRLNGRLAIHLCKID